MTPQAFAKAALALPGATHQVQWGDEQVYKVGGKMFAVIDGAASRVSLKVSDIAFEALTESGRARTAPYLARAKWVQFEDLAALDPDEVADWLGRAHALVAAKLTRKARAELGLVQPKASPPAVPEVAQRLIWDPRWRRMNPHRRL